MRIEINMMEFDHTKPSKAKLSKERNNPVSHHKQCYIVLNLIFFTDSSLCLFSHRGRGEVSLGG